MVLFINACVRAASRTRLLAEHLLVGLEGEVRELRLEETKLPTPDERFLQMRDTLSARREFAHPIFALAREFVQADTVVIAAPFWDLSFPATLKRYFELVNVPGLAFVYTEQGWPRGLCSAKRLYYVTTSGGPIQNEEYGFGYIRALAEGFYQIPEIRCIRAEGLDLPGADIPAILRGAEEEIDRMLAEGKRENPDG